MSHATQAKQLFKVLSANCEQAMLIVDTLLEEQASLIKMETDKLGELSLKKESQMFDLEKQFQTDLEAAAQAGYPKTADGFEQWVDDLAQYESRLVGTYETLKTTLEQAKRLNQTNGDLVTEQLAGLKQRISILTAASVEKGNSQASDTYGPKGGLAGGPGSRPRAVIR